MLAGLLLALSTTILWSLMDALRKHLSQKVPSVAIIAVLSIGASIIPFTIMCIESSIYNFGGDRALKTVISAIISTILNINANLLFIKAIQISPLSLTIPYLGFSPVFIMIGSFFILNQIPSIISVIGILMVVIGATFLSFYNENNKTTFKSFKEEKGSILMLLVAIIWSITSICDGYCVKEWGANFHAFYQNISIGIPMLLWVLVKEKGSIKQIIKVKYIFLISIVVMSLAIITQFMSWKYLLVAYSDAIKRSGGMISSTLAGYFVFKEKNIKKRFPSVVLMSLGVVMIILGN